MSYEYREVFTIEASTSIFTVKLLTSLMNFQLNSIILHQAENRNYAEPSKVNVWLLNYRNSANFERNWPKFRQEIEGRKLEHKIRTEKKRKIR